MPISSAVAVCRFGTKVPNGPARVPWWVGHRRPDTSRVTPGRQPDPGIWAYHCHILTHAEGDNSLQGRVTAWVVAPA